MIGEKMQELTIKINEDYMGVFLDMLEKMPKDKVQIKNPTSQNTKQAISEIMASLEDKEINEVFERLKDK